MARLRSRRAKPSTPIITLLTDFGDRDGYVASMKGVLATHAPEVTVVDICHAVAPQDLLHAGVVWSAAIPYFPPGCVHVGVVDPGVGSARRILAVEVCDSIFLVPDNGLVGYVARREEIVRVIEVRERRFFLEAVSTTFHGRDIFAPVAARLALGLHPAKLGPAVDDFELRSLPTSSRRTVCADPFGVEETGEVIDVDTFGNITTNLRPSPGRRFVRLKIADFESDRLATTYSDVAVGESLVLVGSTGFLEIAVRGGSAGFQLGVQVGADVRVEWEGGS